MLPDQILELRQPDFRFDLLIKLDHLVAFLLADALLLFDVFLDLLEQMGKVDALSLGCHFGVEVESDQLTVLIKTTHHHNICFRFALAVLNGMDLRIISLNIISRVQVLLFVLTPSAELTQNIPFSIEKFASHLS